MKFLLALLSLCSSFSALSGQSGLLLEPDSMFLHDQNADLSNEWMNYGLYMEMTNASNDTLVFIWERMLSANCPEEWDFTVSDMHGTYVPTVTMSIEGYPIVLIPQQETYFGIDVWPRSVPGCGTVYVPFTDLNNPDIILDTAYFDIIFNSDCLPSNVRGQDLMPMEIGIFPNPAHTEVWVGGEALLNFNLYNPVGLLVKSGHIDSGNQRNIELQELPDGVYFIHFFNPLNNSRQVSKLVKN